MSGVFFCFVFNLPEIIFIITVFNCLPLPWLTWTFFCFYQLQSVIVKISFCTHALTLKGIPALFLNLYAACAAFGMKQKVCHKSCGLCPTAVSCFFVFLFIDQKEKEKKKKEEVLIVKLVHDEI